MEEDPDAGWNVVTSKRKAKGAKKDETAEAAAAEERNGGDKDSDGASP